MATDYMSDENIANDNSAPEAMTFNPEFLGYVQELRRNMPADLLAERDGVLAFQALFYAIACMQDLPEERQNGVKLYDLCEMVRREDDLLIALHLSAVEANLGHEIDLWFDELKADEKARKDHIRRLVDKQRIV